MRNARLNHWARVSGSALAAVLVATVAQAVITWECPCQPDSPMWAWEWAAETVFHGDYAAAMPWVRAAVSLPALALGVLVYLLLTRRLYFDWRTRCACCRRVLRNLSKPECPYCGERI
ncbi:MAG: hypothetical protein A49_15240 [Methyloceanibacter sp.]|nr:MAG: hypothetical protein A49_15240 [Methyloceanibacter sp.]